MTDLTVRKLLIDLDTPFELRWNGGDAFTSALMNALSLSFPVGEQFFIDSLRRGVKELSPELQATFAQDIKGFIGQEATHRRIHERFNHHVLNQGMVNHWEKRALGRIEHINQKAAIHAVAITAAYEHFTSVFAAWLLSHPEFLAQAPARLQTLWLWHASEETEHRSVSFDIYRAMGGNEVWRHRWMISVSVFFLTDLLRQTCNNLWHDGSLFKASTWRSAWRHLFAKEGLFTFSFADWKKYFSADFHPSEHDDQLSRQWIQTHSQTYQALGQSA
jgi:predicted metal-dependent hydrolase